MKRLLTTTTALALTATTALATDYTPPKEPPVQEPPVVTNSDGGNEVGVALGLLAVLTLMVLHSNKPQQMPQGTPVEPEPDYPKLLELVN